MRERETWSQFILLRRGYAGGTHIACVRGRTSIVVHIVCASCRNYPTETLVAGEFLCWCWVSVGLFTNPPILCLLQKNGECFSANRPKFPFLKEVPRRKERRRPCSFLQFNNGGESAVYMMLPSGPITAPTVCIASLYSYILGRCPSGYGVGLCVGYTSTRSSRRSFDAEAWIRLHHP